MRTIFLCLATCFVLLNAEARITYELATKGAMAKVQLRVVDQDGVAVSGAKLWGAFSSDRLKEAVIVEGVTNTNGEFIARGNCNEFLRLDVTKDGYYHTEVKVNFWQSKAEPIVKDGKWQPYGEERTVVLKKIKKPHAVKVFGENDHRHNIPMFDKWIGFDFEVSDWVTPYGKGLCSDVLLRFKADIRKPRIDYIYNMDICFTNNPFAGAYIMKKDTCSDLQTEYSANTNAIYISRFLFSAECVAEKRPKLNYLDKDSYLVFRTRTRVDDKGKLIGAHYGKISGPWRSTHKVMLFGEGCFNISENDSNIEGDFVLLSIINNYKIKNRN